MAFGQLDGDGEGPGRGAPISDINVTPLVDVMLVLVVIFILTAPLLASSIRLDLPRTEAAQPGAPGDAVTLAIDPQGRIHLGNQPIGEDQLALHLRQLARLRPDAEVQLRADAGVPYGRVVTVMGLVQQAGLNRIGFVAENKP